MVHLTEGQVPLTGYVGVYRSLAASGIASRKHPASTQDAFAA